MCLKCYTHAFLYHTTLVVKGYIKLRLDIDPSFTIISKLVCLSVRFNPCVQCTGHNF